MSAYWSDDRNLDRAEAYEEWYEKWCFDSGLDPEDPHVELAFERYVEEYDYAGPDCRQDIEADGS